MFMCVSAFWCAEILHLACLCALRQYSLKLVVLALLASMRFECFFPFRSILRLAEAVLPTSLFSPSLQFPSDFGIEGTLSVRFEPFRSRGSPAVPKSVCCDLSLAGRPLQRSCLFTV